MALEISSPRTNIRSLTLIGTGALLIALVGYFFVKIEKKPKKSKKKTYPEIPPPPSQVDVKSLQESVESVKQDLLTPAPSDQECFDTEKFSSNNNKNNENTSNILIEQLKDIVDQIQASPNEMTKSASKKQTCDDQTVPSTSIEIRTSVNEADQPLQTPPSTPVSNGVVDSPSQPQPSPPSVAIVTTKSNNNESDNNGENKSVNQSSKPTSEFASSASLIMSARSTNTKTPATTTSPVKSVVKAESKQSQPASPASTKTATAPGLCAAELDTSRAAISTSAAAAPSSSR